MTRIFVSNTNKDTTTNMPTAPSDAPPVTPTPTRGKGGKTPAPAQAAADPTGEVEFIL